MKKLIFILFFTSLARAEIKGVIFEKGRKVKLAGINVYLPNENLMAVTDASGEFILPTSVTKAEIKINASEFIPYASTVDASSPVIIYLQRKTSPSLSLTVEDTNYKKDQSQKSLSRKQIFEMPGAGGDPVKALQNLPGVNRPSGFTSRVIIQGSAPKDTVYDFDGHEIPLVFHFGGLTSVVMPEAVDKVDYFAAGYQSEHSRALGGIISLTTRQPEVSERDYKGLFYVENIGMGGLLEGKINDHSSFLISGRYSYISLFLKSALKDNEDFNFTVVPEFYDLTGVYHYQLAENEKFKISFLNSRDQMAYLFNEPVREDPAIRGTFSNTIYFFRLVPSWEKQLDPDNFLKFSVAYGIDSLNFDIGSIYYNIENKNFSTRGQWEHRSNEATKFNLGWDNIYSDVSARVRIPLGVGSDNGGVGNPISSGEMREADIHTHINNVGAFTEMEYQFNSELKVTPGLRADYFSNTKESHILPRLAAQYKANESLIYKMGSGIYVQSPEPQEINENFGNPDLTSPRAVHLTLGFDKEHEGHFFSMNAFYKKFDHLVVSSSEKKIKNGVEVYEIYNNEGEGLAYGLENQWKYKLDDLQIIFSYTWSKSTRKNPTQGEYNFDYDQTHNLNLISMYQLNDSWKISGRYRFVTGTPYTPIVGATYDADNETYLPQRGEFFSVRNKPFQQLDIRFDKRVVLDQAIWTFYLDIQNILNIKNSEGVQYSYDYRIKEEVAGLPILPTFGIRGEF